MRTKRQFKGLDNGQKVRVIIDGVGIYTKIREIDGLFATNTHGEAVREALAHQSGLFVENGSTGHVADYSGHAVQVDLIS